MKGLLSEANITDAFAGAIRNAIGGGIDCWLVFQRGVWAIDCYRDRCKVFRYDDVEIYLIYADPLFFVKLRRFING